MKLMNLIALAAAVATMSGCATGQYLRTTEKAKDGSTTVYEAKQTGLWFASREPKPLRADSDQLALPEQKLVTP